MPDLAESFGRAAEEYELGRPEYAEAAIDAVGLAPDSVVLDLAAGTGKLTRQLVPRFARVVAVEPLDGMRAVLERVVPEAETLRRQRGRDPARGRRCRRGLRRGGVPLVRDRCDAGRARARPPAARDAGDPLQPRRPRLRAAAAGGVLGGVPRGRDPEAAGADRQLRALEGALPRAVRAPLRGELPEPGRARPGAGPGAGVRRGA